MTRKLTEEQQRAAHKIIVANRGDCKKKDNYLNCPDCPSFYNDACPVNVSNSLPYFFAENLRRSQKWLDEHITDAEIMVESPREFCERMVRTRGNGMCKSSLSINRSFCKECVLSVDGNACYTVYRPERAKAYLAAHPATPQEPPKRRPTPEEMVVGATVRVRSWDELVNDHLTKSGKGGIPFADSMKKYCGNTYKIIKRLNDPFLVCLENCYNDFGFGGHWFFTPEMLDYVAPERVVQPKATEPEPAVKAPTEEKPTDAERIAHLESQVKYLTKKLAASDRKCKRLARRLRAKWEARRDGEMCSNAELESWLDQKKRNR